VLFRSKKVLTDYQDENNYASLDDSLSALLMEFKDHRTKMGELETRVKELEAELAEAKGSK